MSTVTTVEEYGPDGKLRKKTVTTTESQPRYLQPSISPTPWTSPPYAPTFPYWNEVTC